MTIFGANIGAIGAENQEGDNFSYYKFKCPPSAVFATVALQAVNHTDAQGSFSAHTFIENYKRFDPEFTQIVEDGGRLPYIAEQNVFEITFMLSVNGCSALAGWRADFVG